MSANRAFRSQNNTTQGFEEFVAIAQEGSVSGAARVLGLPRATLSRRLSRLEQKLGVRLAHRTSRRLVLTEAGQLLYERARRVLADARQAYEDVARLDDVPRGLLRISVPTGTQEWFARMLGGFLDAHPEISLEVVATLRMVDLVKERIDVVVRGAMSGQDELIGRVLRVSRLVCVATPQYLEAQGVPQSTEDIASHDCIRMVGEGPSTTWPTYRDGPVEVSGRFSSNDILMQWHAALEGRGLALLPDALVRDDESRGTLVRVLDGVVGAEVRIRVLYADRAFLDPKIRAFVDHIFAWAEQNSWFDDEVPK